MLQFVIGRCFRPTVLYIFLNVCIISYMLLCCTHHLSPFRQLVTSPCIFPVRVTCFTCVLTSHLPSFILSVFTTFVASSSFQSPASILAVSHSYSVVCMTSLLLLPLCFQYLYLVWLTTTYETLSELKTALETIQTCVVHWDKTNNNRDSCLWVLHLYNHYT